jgi:uncharacterized protein
MAAVAVVLKQEFRLPEVVHILAGANLAPLAVALAAGLDFNKDEGFVYGHLAYGGWIDSDAEELLRYRKIMEECISATLLLTGLAA